MLTSDVHLLLQRGVLLAMWQMEELGNPAGDRVVHGLGVRLAIPEGPGRQQHAQLDRFHADVEHVELSLRLFHVGSAPLPRVGVGEEGIVRESGCQANDPVQNRLWDLAVEEMLCEGWLVKEGVEDVVDEVEVEISQFNEDSKGRESLDRMSVSCRCTS